MTMSKWVDVGSKDQLQDGAKLCTSAAGQELVVLNVDGELYAIANVCPHAGMPIGEGDCRGHVITCPFHGYAYDIRSGRHVEFPHEELPVQTFRVRVEGERVQVQLPDPSE